MSSVGGFPAIQAGALVSEDAFFHPGRKLALDRLGISYKTLSPL